MSDGPTAAQLLEDAAWLKKLALRLAGDADDADDLVQESWIAAWRRGPDASRSLRPWFTKVVRDLALMKRRADGRRALRDRSWDDGREAASPEELLGQLRLHRVLVDLVLELDEPYRATIVARFVEGRSAAEIARAQGIPESTVRGRLRDGLARLRARLDEHNGGRRAWAPAVLAFARGGIAVAKPTKGILALLALLAVLALLVGAVVVGGFVSAAPGTGRTVVAPVAAPAASHVPALAAPSGRLDALLTGGHTPGWIAQAGAPRRRLAGHVLVDGQPAAGALVRVTSDLSASGLVPVLEQRTREGGTFDFGLQLARPLTVSASAPSRLAAIQEIDLRDPRVATDGLELALTACAASLYGKVLDATGTPIAHAELRREDAVGTESDARGAYELCVLPTAMAPEQLLLVVRASGYGALTTAVAPAGRVRHDFVLAPEATISGTAFGPDGAPVADVQVWSEPDDAESRPDEQPARALAVTDERGRFQLSGLAGGRHRLGGRGEGVSAPPIVVSVGAGETKDVTLRLAGVGVVRGHVLRGDQPVSGARVAVAEDASVAAVSQADGSFVLDRVPVGTVHLGATPFRVRSPGALTVAPGENPPVTLAVEALAGLRGTVRHDGAPVANARVNAIGPSKLAAQADAHGRYTLDGLEPGAYTIVADDTSLSAYVDGLHVTLAAGEVRPFDVELLSGARIGGTVVDAAGAPVAGAQVRFTRLDHMDSSRCVADDAGVFECRQLAGGTYVPEVFPSAAGSAAFRFVDPEPVPVVLADRAAHADGARLVVVAETRAIAGIVVDPSGAPIADARVRVSTSEGGGSPLASWMPPPGGVSNVDGTFRIEGVAPGRYTLEVRTRDGSKSLHSGIVAGALDVRLVIAPACSDERAIVHDVPAELTGRPPARIVWDGRVELVGWSVPAEVRPGADFDMAFAYRVLAPVDRSWNTFVHVDGTEKRLGADHAPVGGRCPMTSWQPGDVIIDRFTARFGADYAPGVYTVSTGFFIGWAGRWVNMPVSDAPAEARGKGDSVRVGSIVVQAGP